MLVETLGGGGVGGALAADAVACPVQGSDYHRKAHGCSSNHFFKVQA
jgi:hypothetical protein